MAARLEAMGSDKYRGLTRRSGNRFIWTGKIRIEEKALGIPYTWSKPRLVSNDQDVQLYTMKLGRPPIAPRLSIAAFGGGPDVRLLRLLRAEFVGQLQEAPYR